MNKNNITELQDAIDAIPLEQPIIVEGKKDAAALRALNIQNKIITLNKPIYAIIESITSTHCMILTDLDKKGKELYGKIAKNLRGRGVHVNDKFRNFLLKETTVKEIEGLKHYAERIISSTHAIA